MNKVLEKKISNALILLATQKIDYFTFAKAIRWDDVLADNLQPLVEMYVKFLGEKPEEVPESILVTFAQKLLHLKERFIPFIRIVGSIKRRRFNFDKIVKRGTYDKWNMSLLENKNKTYIIYLPTIHTTITSTRDEIISVDIDFKKL